ncbi:hypothetical protein HY095_01650 [Candidatus Micrarchaeota archaeon]|nr:hypothetical protein [Candidatus Micrarchaeota archaeon]
MAISADLSSQKSREIYEFKKQIKSLREFRGRGTELISVYMTPGYPISEIAGKLKEEAGAATNIKSTSTRKNVIAALEKIVQYLKTFRETPKTGMAIFCGNLSETEGRQDLQLYSIVPPVPLNAQFYRCESTFVLEPLEELVEHSGAYGLVVMDGKEATVAVLKGKNIKVIKQIHSTAHAKTHKGGQCLHEKTLVQMASGEIKEIREVKPGDKLLSFNWKTQLFEEQECINVFARNSDDALLIKTGNGGEIIATKEHRFFVSENGRVRERFAEDLSVGERLLSKGNLNHSTAENASTSSISLLSQLSISPIDFIQVIRNPTAFFYDLEIPGNENFIANGIVAHNSSQRFSRLREEGIEYFQERIGEAMAAFLEVKNFKGVIVGGPGPAKEDLVKAAPFNYQLKILGIVDTGYTDEYGLREVMEKASDLISEQEAVREKKLLDEFLKEAVRGGLVVSNYGNVKKAIEANQAKMLLVSENQNLYELQLKCGQCGFSKTIQSTNNAHMEDCSECKSGKFRIEKETDLINDIIGLAEERGVVVEMISRETAEGDQFYGTFKGIGAFLRYR